MAAEKYVCANCFADYAVQAFIQTEAVSRECDYCEEQSDNDIAAPLRDVIRFIRDGIETEWATPEDESLLWDSEEGRYMLPVKDSYDLLVESSLSIESDQLLEDINDKLRDFQWCQRDPYRLTKEEEWYSDWESFSEQLKHETRHVFYRLPRRDQETVSNEQVAFEILDEIGEFVSELDLIRTLPQGTRIVRARPHGEHESFSAVEDLGPPSREAAIYSNRMSPAGIPMFYGSTDEDTALAEIHQSKFATVATFETLRSFKILDLTQLPDTPSLFDQQRNYQRPKIKFLWNFLDDIMKRVEKDGREHIEYVPTQVVTEYFRRVFRDYEGEAIKGILYPSARREEGQSYVLFFEIEDCSQNDRLVDASDNKWLSMIVGSVSEKVADVWRSTS